MFPAAASPGAGFSRPPQGCGSPDTDSSQSQKRYETQRWNPCSCCLPWTRPAGPGQTLWRVQTSAVISRLEIKQEKFRNNSTFKIILSLFIATCTIDTYKTSPDCWFPLSNYKTRMQTKTILKYSYFAHLVCLVSSFCQIMGSATSARCCLSSVSFPLRDQFTV